MSKRSWWRTMGACRGVVAVTAMLLGGCGDDAPPEETGTSGQTDPSSSSSSTTATSTPPTTSTTAPTTEGSDSSSTGLGEEEAREEWPLLGCDPLVPSYCTAPFPSNVYSVEDKATATGRRVEMAPELFPVDGKGRSADPAPWNALDGFSPGSSISAHFPGVTQASLVAANVANAATIERSLENDSPTVLLNAATGERVPHWVDLDATGADDAQRMFMIRPAVRIDDATRYIVAIRELQDGTGAAIEPSEAFAALRDRSPSEDETVRSRRALYGDIFAHLADAGVARDDLLLAWDFTTSSKLNNTSWMVHMRDEALELVGPGGPDFTVTSVETDWDPNVAFRIFADMTVPMYLDQPFPLATLQFGADGMPEPNSDMPTAVFEVEILIPQSALVAPAGVMQYGHGLLGEKEQIESGHFRTFINEYNYIIFGVDFIGFASEDEPYVGLILVDGMFDGFENVIERQLQGMLNSLLAMRMMKTSFANDATYGQYVDPERSYYLGISQGGIYGGTYMALTTDVERGVMGVPGMPYNLLLSRSVDFDLFFELVRSSFEDSRDHMLLLNLAQMLWDRIEPTGYAPYIRENRLPGTPNHEVILRAALGDHQVTNYGAHVMARAIGVPHLDTGLRSIFELETSPGPIDGSAYVEYGFGLPPDPVENLPQTQCEDPHGKLRSLTEARDQLDTFYRTGMVENFCADGICDFSALGGCE